MFVKPLLLSTLIEHAGLYHAESTTDFYSVNTAVETQSWAELRTNARAIASALAAQLPPSPQVIAIEGNNTPLHLATMFAISGLGHVYVSLPKHELSKAIMAICDFQISLPKQYRETTFGNHNDTQLQLIGLASAQEARTTTYIDIATIKERDLFDWPVFEETSTAALIPFIDKDGQFATYQASHREIILNALAISLPDSLGLSSHERFLSCVELNDENAWGIAFASALVGCDIGFCERSERNIAAVIEDFQATICIADEFVWSEITGLAEKMRTALESLTRAVVIGDKNPRHLMRVLRDKFDCDLIRAWGLPQTGMLMAFNIPLPKHERMTISEYENLRSWEGRPPYGVHFRIVDKSGQELPWDGRTQGRLEYRSLWANTAGCQKGGVSPWCATDITAKIGKDGFIHIKNA